MRKMFILVTAAAFAGALGVATAATQAAELAYTNFGPKESFGEGGLAVNGPAGVSACVTGDPTSYGAGSFGPSVTGTLNHLDLALTNVGGSSVGDGALATGVHIALVGGNGADAPETTGPALEEWHLSNLPIYGVGTAKATKITSKLHPTLNSGTKYWIVATPGGYDGCVLWNVNVTGATQGFTSVDAGQTWATTGIAPAFDVWISP
jgi:hypothetical protein